MLTRLTNWAETRSVSTQVNIYEAKTHLSDLVERAAAGEDIVIAKNGRPRARLVPVPPRARRQPGALKGKLWMSPEFDADLTDLFEHSDDTVDGPPVP